LLACLSVAIAVARIDPAISIDGNQLMRKEKRLTSDAINPQPSPPAIGLPGEAPGSPVCFRFRPAPTPLHSGIGVHTFMLLRGLAAIFPLTAGCLLFGWRAMGTIGTLIGSCVVAGLIWQRIGQRGAQMRLSHCIWLGMLLALMLPAHLFSGQVIDGQIVWPIIPAAAITAVALSWLLGGLGAERIAPAVAAFLLIFVMFHHMLTPHYVLKLDHIGRGDLLKIDPIAGAQISRDPWVLSPASAGPYEALLRDPVADKLIAYTSAQVQPDRASITMQMLIRDDLPPLEDLITGGQASGIGEGSAIGVIIGGLFLMYRGMIDFRLPLFGTLATMVSLLILPVPVLIADSGAEWHWLAFRQHILGWPTAITFTNYELLASPLLLTLFFFANSPGLRPLTRRGRAVFAIGLGMISAVCQLYFSVAIGPYIALLVIGLLTPTLDRILQPKTLV
jgi:electron transport complex protein RnfD